MMGKGKLFVIVFFLLGFLTQHVFANDSDSCDEELENILGPKIDYSLLKTSFAFDVFKASTLVQKFASKILHRKASASADDFLYFTQELIERQGSLPKYLKFLVHVQERLKSEPTADLEDVAKTYWEAIFASKTNRLLLPAPAEKALREAGLPLAELEKGVSQEGFETVMRRIEREAETLRTIRSEFISASQSERAIRFEDLLVYVRVRHKIAHAALALYIMVLKNPAQRREVQEFVRANLLYEVMEGQILETPKNISKKDVEEFTVAYRTWQRTLDAAIRSIL